jgi:hypothetical protein
MANLDSEKSWRRDQREYSKGDAVRGKRLRKVFEESASRKAPAQQKSEKFCFKLYAACMVQDFSLFENPV